MNKSNLKSGIMNTIIDHCHGEKCTIRLKCYRFMHSHTDSLYEWYGAFELYLKGRKCSAFISNKKRLKNKLL